MALSTYQLQLLVEAAAEARVTGIFRDPQPYMTDYEREVMRIKAREQVPVRKPVSPGRFQNLDWEAAPLGPRDFGLEVS